MSGSIAAARWAGPARLGPSRTSRSALSAAARLARGWTAMSDVHQCPFCELKFPNLNELKFHIEMDHPDRHVPERRY